MEFRSTTRLSVASSMWASKFSGFSQSCGKTNRASVSTRNMELQLNYKEHASSLGTVFILMGSPNKMLNNVRYRSLGRSAAQLLCAAYCNVGRNALREKNTWSVQPCTALMRAGFRNVILAGSGKSRKENEKQHGIQERNKIIRSQFNAGL